MQKIAFYTLLALFCVDIIRKRINPQTPEELKIAQQQQEKEELKKDHEQVAERIKEKKRLEKEQRELEGLDLELKEEIGEITNSNNKENKANNYNDRKLNYVNEASLLKMHIQYE